MTIIKSMLTFFLIISLTACQEATVLPSNIKVTIKESRPVITKVMVKDGQLLVTGQNLDRVTLAKVEGSSNHQFQIESKSGNKLVLNARSALNFLVGESLNLIVSNAYGAVSFPISFELKNGQVESVHLDDMGASTGQVLRFNGTNWVPASQTSSQTYAGTYDAAADTPDITTPTPSPGTYYIVTNPGSPDLGSGALALATGDWVIFNGSTWEKVTNTSGVISFNGRSGAVSPASDDYSWSMLQKTSGKLTGSRISEIEDVDVLGIQDGDILIWNQGNLKWEVGEVPAATLTSGSVTNTTIATGAIDSSKISDGTIVNADISASAAIDQSKIAGLTTALAGKEASLPTGGTTAQYFRGDKTLGNFGSSVLATQIVGYTTGTAIPLVAADTIPGALGKLEAYIAALNTAQNNYVLKNGTTAMTADLQMGNNQITGLGAPGADADAATKKYVDDAIAGVGGGQWTTSGSNIFNANAGNVGIGTATPSALLEVAGQVKITGGSPGAGKVLTSDAAGLATWAIPSAGLPAGSTSVYFARVATTANIALSGLQTVDGVSLTAGERVLVKNQSTPSQNGVYEVAAGAWTRVADLDTWSELNGYEIIIREGSSFSGFKYSAASNASGTMGTSAIRFSSQGAGRFNENLGIGKMALNEIANSDNVAVGAWSMTQATSAWSNVAVGNYSLQDLTSGNRNSAFGVDAALNNQDGYYNTAIGNEALENNISGFSNTAVGKSALSNATGSNNTALGYLSGSAITTGTNNVVIGSNDGASIAATSNNILISDGAGNLRLQIDGTGNVGIGAAASGGAKLQVTGQVKITGGSPGVGKVLTSDASGLATWTTLAGGGSVTSVSGTAPIAVATGTTTPVVSISQANTTTNGYLSSTDWNIFNDKQASLSAGATINGIVFPANGTQTLQIPLAPVNLTDAVNKQYVDSFGLWGTSAGNVYRTSGNVGIGTSTPTKLLEVNGDILINGLNLGRGAGNSDSNVAFGKNALNANTTGWQNVAIGEYAMESSVTSIQNTAVGSYALIYDTGSSNNVAVGTYALEENGGDYNTAVGVFSLGDNTSGESNTAIGEQALLSNETGSFNIGLGRLSMVRNKTGNTNIAIGIEAGFGGSTIDSNFSNNTMIGYRAGYALRSAGINNILIGFQAGDQFSTGTNNIVIGHDIDLQTVSTSNTINIGNLIFGTGVNGVGTTLSTGNVGIGTFSPGAKLEVAGQVKITGGSPGVGKVLTSDATGLATWTTLAGGGTVTSVTGTAPISVATGTTTPVVSISQATTSTDGYLSSMDWNTFNEKQAALASGATINGIVFPANGTQTLQIPLAPVNLTDAVNKQYVDSFGHWGTSAGNVYRTSGNVGVGTATPLHPLHVEGPFLVQGEWGNGDTLAVSGAGTRMFFYPRKVAFRGGYTDTEWDDANIGEASFAYGVETLASGFASIAMGERTTASGNNSIAIGDSASASQDGAVAFAEGQASGTFSTAFDSSSASGFYSVAMGSSDASGDRSIAMGSSANANGEYTVAIGGAVVSNSFRSVSVGAYNLGSGADMAAWLATDPIFEVGNGTSNASRSNAMTVLKNGNVGIGNSAPDERLVVYNGSTTGKYTATGWTHSSDARLKHDIFPLENSLEKILKLQGVEYKFNYDSEKKTQVGFVAQEAEKIFPEVVVTDDKGFKSMVYANLVAPLVEAVKTLYKRMLDFEKQQVVQNRQIASKADKVIVDSKVQKLEIENARLKQENEEIKARLEKIEKVLNSKSGPL